MQKTYKMMNNIRHIIAAITLFPLALYAQDEIIVDYPDEIQDEVVEIPEGMTVMMDSLLNEFHTRRYIRPNTACHPSAENPVFDKETYIKRLSRLPNIMEMPYNDIVRRFIDSYAVRLRDKVPYLLSVSNFYMPIFEEALEAHRVPLELKYLPVIESALHPEATSRAGAGGLWQFMVSTGKLYGLKVNSLLDERRDPIKSSYAAARYLKDLYGIFHDWTLVIAAYNCGPHNVNKAIRRAGGNTTDYWKIYPYLPRETRGYVPAFIAANYIMTYHSEHGICPAEFTMPMSTDTIMVARKLHFEQIKALCNIPVEEIRALNPQYRRGIVPGDASPCIVRLPTPCINAFIAAGDSIYNYRSQELFNRREVEMGSSSYYGGSDVIRVRRGDTLGSIARRNHTSVKTIQRLNGLKGTTIRPGQRLRVR